MKNSKYLRVLVIVALIMSALILQGCQTNSLESESYLRIHIRANSNLEVDQNIKYEIKDEIVEYLTPIIASINNVSELKTELSKNLSNMTALVNKMLKSKNFNYSSNVLINNEFFPTRYYGDNLLQADYYDALIVELGSAEGDNWWCVVYPPLCFVGGSQTLANNFKYKSKIKELIDKFSAN